MVHNLLDLISADLEEECLRGGVAVPLQVTWLRTSRLMADAGFGLLGRAALYKLTGGGAPHLDHGHQGCVALVGQSEHLEGGKGVSDRTEAHWCLHCACGWLPVRSPPTLFGALLCVGAVFVMHMHDQRRRPAARVQCAGPRG